MMDDSLSRGAINKHMATITRVFKWAVSEELVPPSVDHFSVHGQAMRRV